MESLEITAKSLDEARQTAAAKLGVDPDRVELTVLEETKGLFGKSSLRVRAEAGKASAQEKPAKAAGGRTGRGRAAKPEAEEAPHAEGGQSEALEDIQQSMEEPPETAQKTERKRRGGRGKSQDAPAPEAEAAASPNGEAGEGGEEATATAQDAKEFETLLRDLLDAADLQVQVKSADPSGRYVNVVLDGKDVAYLVGKHGEVLNALQYLVNVIAARRLNNGVRATLDGNDYRRRRESQLSSLANRIAEQVRDRGEEAVLDALPAFERRIIHKALSEMDGITTYSEGEEPARRVVIAPAE
jgi:spoIIIJ-associated protein